MSANLVKLCRLFANKSAAGKTYWSGRLGDARVILMLVPNNSGASADLDLFIAPQRAAPDKAPAPKSTPGYQLPLSSRTVPSRRANRAAAALYQPIRPETPFEGDLLGDLWRE